MQIVRDERVNPLKSTCEHCGKFAEGRYEKVKDAFGSERGSFFLCFECFPPRIFWREEGRHSKVYATPVSDNEP